MIILSDNTSSTFPVSVYASGAIFEHVFPRFRARSLKLLLVLMDSNSQDKANEYLNTFDSSYGIWFELVVDTTTRHNVA